jgi:hypothetical protein
MSARTLTNLAFALSSFLQFINLSLSFLEQVIIALQERSMGLKRGHVPYRNSTLTTVLRDSLGGNCRTAMIATVQPVATQIEESIATCRFAQRVAMISNRVAANEEARRADAPCCLCVLASDDAIAVFTLSVHRLIQRRSFGG